ncbi:hypothetical protein FE257_005234 [Aspergillus nanangensis]|uniref:Spindle pole body-associated protein cut12 domain-containing protein n=1 Tax=Aspergillus nanangensis TaxID=2582783 RepID=A0AAD4CR92_ASPNN|nr:hypothetical protein FE257_005234 [Aspergillus nanangensis]
MLDWISAQDGHAADTSKVLEPPETPAPVFAIRAFKSALFGTPGADDEDKTEGEVNPRPTTTLHRKSEPLKLPPSNAMMETLKPTKTDKDAIMGSPTKSILVTPGTATNRRKTVSFGESVVDNERKRDEPLTRTVRTPVSASGSPSSQWSGGSSKPRSKLTQALMDSREKTPKDSGSSSRISDEELRLGAPKGISTPADDTGDETINLDEPRSQSGKYWKSEFDSYRTKTTQEIRRLIQYRSAAKSYARKKDTEAQRLTDKLKEEEVKVAEMERHVTQLASTMVGERSNSDKEQLIQELTKQTALALQYKHRVSLLRKLLEKHGVVGGEMDEIAGPTEEERPSSEASRELRKTQHSLEQANAKIEEMKHQQLDFSKLRDLALSSEQKATELEKENATLKQTLARFKEEMTKYEGRRKEKEAKLKQREAKLETRIQEYRERLKTASQEHRMLEQDLRDSFEDERRHMQEQIDMLNLKVATFERLPEIRARARYSESPRKGYTGVQVYDFGQNSPQKAHQDETEDIEEPPSPSPRAKDRHSQPRMALGELDLKRASKALGYDDTTDQLIYEDKSPRKPQATTFPDEGDDALPPSSPPPLSSFENNLRARPAKQRFHPDSYRSYVPSHTTMAALARQLASLDDSQQVRTERLRSRRSPAKYSLDAIAGLPESYLPPDRPRRRQSLASLQRESLPIDRRLAAQARLKRRGEGRKSKDGKENLRTTNI